VNFLLFISSFVFLLSSVSARETVTGSLPLPVLLEKAGVFLFPFGSPAFRINITGALLTALTPVLALRLFTLARPRPGPGPILFELEDERKWTVASLMVLSLGILSPAFLHTGTGGITPAANLFFSLLALERGVTWKKSRRAWDQWRAVIGMVIAGGFAVTLDLRWVVLLPGLLAIRRPLPTPKKSRMNFWFHVALMGILGGIAFLTPWIVLTSFHVATPEQLVRLLPMAIRDAYSPFFQSRPTAFLLIGSLLPCYFLIKGLRLLLARFPKTGTSVFLIALVMEFILLFSRSVKPVDREAVREHLLRGDNFARAQVPDQAEEEYLAALAIAPNDGSIYERLGALLLEYGDGARAAAAFARAARFQPKSQNLLADWASAELMNGRIPNAIDLLREAVDMKNENDLLREKLATLYEKMDRPGEAARQWKILSDRRPEDKSVLWRLAQTLTAATEFDQARLAVDRYLALDLEGGESQAAKELKSFLERSPSR
jgi:Tfp pilus assembly protein PilF